MASQLPLDFLPELDYQLIVSSRARRLSLKVLPGRGLVVTIPKRLARRHVPDFVEKNRVWIETALADLERQTPLRYRQWPPETLTLPAIGQEIRICFDSRNDQETRSRATTLDVAVITACPGNKAAVATELAAYLKRLALDFLPARLDQLATLHGLDYRRVQIRGQRTRWGSCSSSGTISLNYKLMFLSTELVDYVLLHELAHTRHLDHSPAFWRQLSGMHPGARVLDRQLNEAGREVPPWLELAN